MADLVIIGRGPAGLTAGIYASRFSIDSLVSGLVPGGTAAVAFMVSNFPTEIDIRGIDLARKMEETARNAKVAMQTSAAKSIELLEDTDTFNRFVVHFDNGKDIEAKSVIIASGTKRRHLGLPLEEKLEGKGVHYCATCDGPFYHDKVVAVVGGGNAALTSALNLAGVASKVYVLCLEKPAAMRGETAWIEKVKNNPKITIVHETKLLELIEKNGFLSAIKLNKPFEGKDTLDVNGIFVEIGGQPSVPELINFSLETTASGAIMVDKGQKTNVDGVFAAGDVTNGSNGVKQIITACAEGAIAADSAFKYIKSISK